MAPSRLLGTQPIEGRRMKRNYHESSALVERLHNASDRGRPVMFLVGSPLSYPDHVGGHGVPGVSGMIELIRKEFEGTEAEAEFNREVRGASTDQYRAAFNFLQGRRPQDDINGIVRSAVWQALDGAGWPPHMPEVSAREADDVTCGELEKKASAWVLPRAVDTLGNLLVSYSDTFGSAVLTTNFDPLIEVSIRKHAGQYYRTVLHDDGNLRQTVGEGTHIVHLHGYWYGYDTLHTPSQLVQPRPRLRRSLEAVIKSSALVVIGYGGWDDVITQTLGELLADSESSPEIMWAFHEGDEAKIEGANQRLLDALGPGVARGRVSLYRGVSCYALFSEVYERLKPNYPTPIGKSLSPTIVEENSGGATGTRQLSIRINIPLPEQHSADSDQPLIVDPWIGREQELNILSSILSPIAFITGIGGQGKSALAGRFLQQHAMSESGRFDTWDWRDCREESDRLSTQILRIVERFSNGAVDTSQVEGTDIRALTAILFRTVRTRKLLLVFDNVDQYVDLETQSPVKGLDVLVAEAQARSHNCLFLFTCRPDIRVDESRAVRIPLAGLSEDETCELVKACGIRREEWNLAKELHKTTGGHPLWVRLVTMQAIRLEGGLSEAMNLVRVGGETLPETTRTIWGQLNDQQRNVLRTMAELDRPEPESRLLEFLPGTNTNRINRALRVLRSFHLVETRVQPNGEPLLGLHPIIREFIRRNFAKREREKFVGGILGFLDRMIGQFKDLLSQEPSYQILEHWARKAEYQIEFGKFEEATSTIAEIVEPLVQRGYSEEMIRLAMRLFGEIDWAEACASYRDFDSVFSKCANQMTQVGHDATEDILKLYEDAIPGKSSQFILLCDLRCYANWYSGKFESAIEWGERGSRLKTQTSVDTGFSTTHNLALSLRDGGRIEEALAIFLEGESLQTVARPGEKVEGKNEAFYGNIGRCLFLMGRLEQAEVCYVKSAELLEASGAFSDRQNKGYIRIWIAELLLQQESFTLAAAVFRAAECMWEECSPPRAVQANRRLVDLVSKHPEVGHYLHLTVREVEFSFTRWLNRH